jgi:RHS repeat-associated protein
LARLSSAVPDNAPCDYTYDAIYRLIEATGREHIGQTTHDFNPPDGNRRDFPLFGLHAQPNDLQAMRRYTERFEYDAVGNFGLIRHIANGGSYTRAYEYNAPSLLEAAKNSNRLTKTTIGNGLNFSETYTYADALGKDIHGCMTAINSMAMEWDFRDRLRKVDLGGGGTAYYVYDIGGQRVRKVVEAQNGTLSEERLYLGGFEIYRKFGGNALVRETLHVMDDKQRIALIETKTQESGAQISNPQSVIRCQLGNHLGSASMELDKDGGLISYEEYYPYGTSAYQTMNGVAEVGLKRYRYTGKERDEETGLHYHETRYYAPWLGRWTTVDPSGMVDGPNQYSYVRNDPVRLIDPTGTEGDELQYGLEALQQIIVVNSTEIGLKPPSEEEFKAQRADAAAEGKKGTAREGATGRPKSEASPECQVNCHFGNTNYSGRVTPGTSPEGPFPRYTPSPVAVDGTTYSYVGNSSREPFWDVWCSDDSCIEALNDHSVMRGLGIVLGLSLGTTGSAGVPSEVGGGRAVAHIDDAAEVAQALDAAPGQRVFYGRPNGEMVAARTSASSITFDTQTDADFVRLLLEQTEGTRPGSHVYLGSGTHGELNGDWAATDPTLAEFNFYNEDVSTISPGQFPALGPQTVFDVATSTGEASFSAAEQTATSLAPGSMTTMRAWCYSTLRK